MSRRAVQGAAPGQAPPPDSFEPIRHSPAMAPALRLVVLAVLAATWPRGSRGSSTPQKWHLADTYDSTNFFDKFDFFTDKSGDAGYSVFQNRSEAFRKGLIAYQGDNVYLGTDHRTVLKGGCEPDPSPGRDSVRIESKARYNHGLIIARFTHTPKMQCGLWPAFWTYGNDWPHDGEVDLLQGYNEDAWNTPTFYASERSGGCMMADKGAKYAHQTAYVNSATCSEPSFIGLGCPSIEDHALERPDAGSVYAMEWTSQSIKLYRWDYHKAPRNVDDDSPDTSAWGSPVAQIQDRDCNIDGHFANQRMVLDLDFCGNPAGMSEQWLSCKTRTHETNCVDYVAKNPDVFHESYFGIKDIRYFQETPLAPSAPRECPHRALT
ncbi:hypothetical protein G6O67_004298 [Ophiocordyceps sinensis]|uniref:GH16 domain-containing protein n=1 Tax=Ophiocordyceps sinensis TaxID=72228 RepID=A0A8H4LYC4_9HYPO|nr:hypothetical protein G6O67_004298 [Ophiocordyceps sinensis]